LTDVVARLAAAGCVAPADEARELLHDAPPDELIEARLRRREDGEPLAWITGRAVFGGLALVIAPGVYVPRPQTEELARRAAAVLPTRGMAVDLCTGSGAVAAWMQRARPDACVVGVECDPVAARCAAANGVRVVVGDLGAAVHAPGRVDVVAAVAPYVPTGERRVLPVDVQRHEPVHALDGGDDGLAVVRGVVAAAASLLREGGHLLLELGGAQDVDLAPDLTEHGFDQAVAWHDDDGDLRGVHARCRGLRSTVVRRVPGPAVSSPRAGSRRRR
jgi:release factor glutamine methyltransferase